MLEEETGARAEGQCRGDPKGLSVHLGKCGLCSEFCFIGVFQAGNLHDPICVLAGSRP